MGLLPNKMNKDSIQMTWKSTQGEDRKLKNSMDLVCDTHMSDCYFMDSPMTKSSNETQENPNFWLPCFSEEILFPNIKKLVNELGWYTDYLPVIQGGIVGCIKTQHATTGWQSSSIERSSFEDPLFAKLLLPAMPCQSGTPTHWWSIQIMLSHWRGLMDTSKHVMCVRMQSQFTRPFLKSICSGRNSLLQYCSQVWQRDCSHWW